MKILAIDPSINSLGWAIFETNDLARNIPQLLTYGTVTSSILARSKLSLEERIFIIIDLLKDAILTTEYRVCRVVIEQPESWGAYKSMASAKSGSLLGLHITVGALLYWAKQSIDHGAFVKVSKWKGQVPKHVTKKRMERKYHVTFKTTDECDAVGIGDWYCDWLKSLEIENKI